jgi:GTP-binding protein Era
MGSQLGDGHRSGFIAVAGRPNVGKSTLVNRIVGQELCIVTPKAQTTRHRITALHNMPNAQIILLDTPGIHKADTPLNRAMVEAAVETLSNADGIIFLTVPSKKIHDEDLRIIELLKRGMTPAMLAINKIDTIDPPRILPLIEKYSQLHSFEEIIPISALLGSGVDELIDALVMLLPESPPLYPEADVSDMPVRFFVSEIIREQVFKSTEQEIPYKTTVVVESFKEIGNSVLIQADIHAERDSQKKILVGKQGQMIKKIGIAAREKIEKFLGSRVRLELFVKVTPHWSRDPKMLKEFGYE